MTPTRVVERLLANVILDDESGCLISNYSRGSHGYSQIGWVDDDGKKRMALGHRVTWEAAHGSIPSGFHVDHECLRLRQARHRAKKRAA